MSPSRYSPGYRPSAPPVPTAAHALSEVFDRTRENMEERRERERQEKEDERLAVLGGLQEAYTRTRLHNEGVRAGTAPREGPLDRRGVSEAVSAQARDAAVRERSRLSGATTDPNVPENELVRDLQGLQETGRGGTATADAQVPDHELVRGLGALGQTGRATREPKIVHPAGSYVPGMGFAPKNITDQDLEPRYAQLTEGFYLDREGTPDVRDRRAKEEAARRAREAGAYDFQKGVGLANRLRALHDAGRDADPELIMRAAEAGVPRELIFPDREEEPYISESGRRFPDTPEGQRLALDWRRRHSAAGRAPEGAGDDGPSEATRRQLATAALQDVQEVRDEIRELESMDDFDVEDLYPQGRTEALRGLRRRVIQVLSSYGFESEAELENEMRDLRGREPIRRQAGTPLSAEQTGLLERSIARSVGGGAGGGADVRGRDVNAAIDAAIRDNPGATPDEIYDIVFEVPQR